MPKLQVPGNVTSITVNAVAKVPDADSEITVTAAEMAVLAPIQFQEMFRIAAANGNVTLQLPPIVTAITIGGVGYVGDGSNQITVPAAAASLFMRSLKGQPFRYARA